MKSVSQLYNRHPDSDIYIIGTGPSLRVFPLSLLKGRITIGLNDAHKFHAVTYAITVHPDLYIPKFSPLTWITKYDKMNNLVSDEQMRHAEEHFYFFESKGRPNTAAPDQPRDEGRMTQWLERPCGDFLYLWSSISQTAVNLAANMGARNIFLIGCDQNELLGEHHAHVKPTRWKGVDPAHRYRQYYEGLVEVRDALKSRGVNLVSLSPFLGLGRDEEEFKRLCRENGSPEEAGKAGDRSPKLAFRERIQKMLGRK